MIGGLALFLYGMNLMGDGLSKASGGRLESILEKLTNKPVKAVLVGAGVTAVIQSSSATTVMVVGFVNSGIMRLEQAVNVIIGANVGTTITAWLLSLSGIESGSFFVQLLKPSSFSPVLAIIGVSLISFSKKDRRKDIGSIMAGFAIISMIGSSFASELASMSVSEQIDAMRVLRVDPVEYLIVPRFLAGVIMMPVVFHCGIFYRASLRRVRFKTYSGFKPFKLY